MGNSNLSNNASVKEIGEWLASHTDQYIDRIALHAKKKSSATERGKVRRNIEAIKERNRLRELLGDDEPLDS
ncbi:PA3496 family putative envelope integrity protein [Psychromonas hadalis]|uniref:PA3496 family putative envelope integrity protein n=1 Tax=Psychromonas hadalis TaxID=211669 RepID=UPI0003B60BBB|nr:hypothetical protein [Psychromonas hadalis]